MNYIKMEYNILRYCNQSRWLLFYWLENIYTGILSDQQKSFLIDCKLVYASWIITTGGYFDKAISGNWMWQEQLSESNKDSIINVNHLLVSQNFKTFQKQYYDIMITRTNPLISCLGIYEKDAFPPYFDREREIFINTMYPESIPNAGYFRSTFGTIWCDSNKTFQLCNGKNVLIINFFADLIRDHYNSGTITEWYMKLRDTENCEVPYFNTITSIEIPYPFGNGINENKDNNFFEMLQTITSKIDTHPEPYDIALISAGIYGPFIADYIEKKKNKQFRCYGRELNNIFLIKYGNSYDVDRSEFKNKYMEKYLCKMPDKYRVEGYKNIEGGNYWFTPEQPAK